MAAKQAGLKLVQYVAVRGDLVKEWPLGAIVAQACHASTAVMHMFRDDPYTVEYLSDLDRMHKIVLKVSVYAYHGYVYMLRGCMPCVWGDFPE